MGDNSKISRRFAGKWIIYFNRVFLMEKSKSKGYSDEYIENIAIYRKIRDLLIPYNKVSAKTKFYCCKLYNI